MYFYWYVLVKSLNITGNYNDVIISKKTIKIVRDNIIVLNINEIKNSVCIKDDIINIISINIGIKITKYDNPEKEYIVTDGGNIIISLDNDEIIITVILIL